MPKLNSILLAILLGVSTVGIGALTTVATLFLQDARTALAETKARTNPLLAKLAATSQQVMLQSLAATKQQQELATKANKALDTLDSTLARTGNAATSVATSVETSARTWDQNSTRLTDRLDSSLETFTTGANSVLTAAGEFVMSGTDLERRLAPQLEATLVNINSMTSSGSKTLGDVYSYTHAKLYPPKRGKAARAAQVTLGIAQTALRVGCVANMR